MKSIWVTAISGCALLAVHEGCSPANDIALATDSGMPVWSPGADAATAPALSDAGLDASLPDAGASRPAAPEASEDAPGLDAKRDAAGPRAPDASTACDQEMPLRLSGAFLQVTNSYGAPFWRSAIDQMHNAGMSTAIIQTVAYANRSGNADNVNTSNIMAVLDEAAAVGLGVYIGLRLEPGNGSPSAAADPVTVNGWISAARASADAIVVAYGGHPAFSGWYLPMEGWTPARAGELGLLPSYYSEVSRYCKSKKNLPVAISPFISAGALAATGAPSLTTSAYSTILAASSIDVVMLQDGLGALPIAPAAIGSSVPPFMGAMKSACLANNVELWANVEAFEHDFATPTTLSRMKAQLHAAAATAARAVTFEFSSYWYGAGPGGAAAASLYDGYVQGLQACRP